MKLFVLSMLMFAFFYTNAQINISGSVRDSAKNKALNLVTVGLYKPGESAPVKITYTKEGKFTISAEKGSYDLIFSYTGFTEKKIGIIVNENIQMPDVLLSASTANLGNLTVTSKRSLVEQSDDKISYNVENDPTAKTSTAIDLLRKTPFVTVDGDNNISVNGQTNFKVLLNGKETAMFAQNVKEALKGFPGALITKIEVITTPSAKYDAEGIGGVINIITKKKVVGYNGYVSAYYSNTRYGNTSTNFSLKSGKMGMTVNYFAGGSAGQPGTLSLLTLPKIPAPYTRRYQYGESELKNFFNFGNGEINYEIDSLHTVSAYGNVGGGNNKSENVQEVQTDFTTGGTDVSSNVSNSNSQYPSYTVGTDLIKKFKHNKEQELDLRLNGEFSKNNEHSRAFQSTTGKQRFVANDNLSDNRQYTIQVDYIHPFTKGKKLETGVKAIIRNAEADYQSMIKFAGGDDYKTNPSNTNQFSYDQNVYSVYASYNFKLGKFSSRIGLRAEHTEVDGDFVSSNAKVKQSYTSLLPNIQFTKKMASNYTVVASYTKRLQRPFIWNLNPFVNNTDSFNIRFGNPNLDPQTIHSVSFQNRFSKGATFIGLTLTGSYSNDMIVTYTTFNPATGVSSTTSGNYGKEIQLSINGSVNTRFTPEWSLFVNGNVRYNRVTSKINSLPANAGIGGNANLNTDYKFNKRISFNSYIGFWGSPVSLQGRNRISYWYGSGLAYKFYHEKFTVNASAANFLQKRMSYYYFLKDPAFESTSIRTIPFRAVALSLSWNFGKLTENVSKKKGVTNDDLLGNGSNN